MAALKLNASKQQARRVLRRLPRILSGRDPDPTGLVRQLQIRLATVALSFIKQAFVEKASGGTDESGMRWAPLAESTVKARRKGTGSGTPQILRDTGLLLNSLSPEGSQNVIEPGAGMVEVGTNVPYAQWLHNGTETIPRRPLWPNPEDWPDRWWAALQRAMLEALPRIIEEMIRRGAA